MLARGILTINWLFDVIAGPTEAKLIVLAMRNLVGLRCLAKFMVQVQQLDFAKGKIKVAISSIEKIGDGQWIIYGQVIEPIFEDGTIYFRTEYSAATRSGKIKFNFSLSELRKCVGAA